MTRTVVGAAIILALVAGAARASVTTSASVSGQSDQVGYGGAQAYSANPLLVNRAFSLLRGSAIIGASDITFSDGVVVTNSGPIPGQPVSANTNVGITQSVTNDTGGPVNVDFSSKLLAGAFGLLVTSPASCSDGVVFCLPDLSRTRPLSPVSDSKSGFSVDVQVNGVTVYSLSASLGLSGGVFTADTAAAGAKLSGFQEGLVADDSGVYQRFFSWNDTPLNLDLGRLNAGQTLQVSYDIRTFGDVTLQRGNQSDFLPYQQLAFSAFGDPIGRGGTIRGPGQIVDSIGLTPESIPAPSLLFTPVTGVPEPAAWLTLIGGLALAGAALRGAGDHRSMRGAAA